MLYRDYDGKEVLGVKSAEKLGKVQGIYINQNTKKPVALMVQNKDKRFLLSFKKILGNMDKLTVYNASSLTEETNENLESLFLLHKDIKAFTEDGAELGNFVDIVTKGEKLVWFDKPYDTKYIAGMNDNNIVINLNLRLPKPNNAVTEGEVSPYVPKQKAINDYSFLVGRIVVRDIIDNANNVYIRKGTVINNSVIDMAKKGGKLVYLSLSSLLD